MTDKVHMHTADSTVLQRALKESLPNSITLVYRTQHSNRTEDAYILATFPEDAPSIPHCWAAAYLDRSMRPETELWIFASGEVSGHEHVSKTPIGGATDFCPTCRHAVLLLLDHMSTLPVAPLHPDNQTSLELARIHEKEHPETGPDVRYPISTGAYMRHLLLPSVVTLGTCHHQIVRICQETNLIRAEFPGKEAELNKFIFNIADLPQTRDLPEGLRWGEVREQDIPIIQSRTNIPRSRRTLLSLKSVGVFEEDTETIVAWTFSGLDGSLTTLHTEPEHRGKGIAKAVAAKIFREYAKERAVDAEGKAWAHADVYVGNVQSESVCYSLGGRPGWKIFWVRIDIGQAGALVANA